MSFISYAQNFEDVLLWRALSHIQCGRYLDIGAHDPVVDSVSLAFYHAEWRGTHVEATPYFAARLREARPDEQVIEAAVTDEPGPIEFYEIGDTGLSTGKEVIAKHHLELGFSVRKLLVPSIRLDELLEASEDDLHWLKIDVEGMEADVLRSWGDSSRRPWILVIESTFPNTTRPTHDLWINQVLSRGYDEVYFDGLSRYFLHSSHAELRENFQAPANVFDQFSVAQHHFSAGQLRTQADQLRQQIRDRDAEIIQINEEIIAAAQRHSTEWRTHEIGLRHELEIQLIETRWAERRIAEQEWLSKVCAVENSLREAQMAAHTALAEAKADFALLQERSTQLEKHVARADAATRRADEQLFEARREITILTKSLDDSLAAVAEAQAERDQAKSETAAVRAASCTEIDELQSKLTGEIRRLQGEVRNAGALIRAAVEENPTWLRRVGQAIRLVGPAPAWQRLAAWPSGIENHLHPQETTNQSQNNNVEFPMHGSAPNSARNPYLRANSLPELLSWHDVDFIRCAYVTLLGRQPDAKGEAYYVDRIRQGHSKMEILWQLRRSTEASNHDPGIAGFDRALKLAAWERSALVGALVRLLTGNQWEAPNRATLRAIATAQEIAQQRFDRTEQRLEMIDAAIRTFGELAARPHSPAAAMVETVAPVQMPMKRPPPILVAAERIRADWNVA